MGQKLHIYICMYTLIPQIFRIIWSIDQTLLIFIVTKNELQQITVNQTAEHLFIHSQNDVDFISNELGICLWHFHAIVFFSISNFTLKLFGIDPIQFDGRKGIILMAIEIVL